MKFIKKKISELSIELIDGDRGKNYPKKNEFLNKGDCVFLNAKNVTSNDFCFEEINFITKEKDKLLNNGKLKRKDIVLTTRGTVGNVAYYSEKIPFECMRINSGMIIIRCQNSINEKYIYWYMRTKQFKNQIKELQTGSAQPQLPLSIIKNMVINICNMKNQNKIVYILDKIQEKINLNTHINNNLYELSSVLYKKWFGELNENNSVPFSQFDKLGKVVMGQSPKGESYNYNEDGVPLINGAADYEKSFLKAQKYTTMPTKICNRGDLIFCIRATIGLLTICDKKYCLGRGVAGITNIDEIYKEYSYHLIESSIESFKRLATGSVIVGITRDDIQNIKVKVPSLNQIDNFHEIQKPIFQKAECIKEEIRRLSQLRDILLPKLMNGEIDLDKIEI